MDKLYSLTFLLFVVPFTIATARNVVRTKSVGVILDLDSLVGKMARTSITMAVEDFYDAHSNYSTRLALHTRDSKSDDVQAALAVAAAQNQNRNIPVGVILDLDTLIGKMAMTSIAMALEDFYTEHSNYSTRLVLHTRDSNYDDVQATFEALDLIQNMTTEVIIGPQRSSQAVMVSEIGNKSHVAVISFSATNPTLYPMQMPYFIRTTINDSAQVYAITALIKAYGWREVVPVYGDTNFGRDFVPFLADALAEINVRIPYRSILAKSSTDDQIRQELYKLKTMQTRVFVVHMSSSRGANLFLKAKEVGMMSEGYVWIMTNGVTNMIDSFNASVTSAMKGALGVRVYVPMAELNNFTTRYKKRFLEDHPQEISNEPSIYSLWAYDTVFAVAMAVENVGLEINKIENFTGLQSLPIFSNGPRLLQAIFDIKFRGLSGNFELVNGELQYNAFEIINMVGRGIRDVGYWRLQHGLSKELDEHNNKTYSASLEDLNPVIWPGESVLVPKGWEIPVTGRQLRVGVTESLYPEFMKVDIDPDTNAIKPSGFAVEVFEAALQKLPYAVPYVYVNFVGEDHGFSSKYDDFVHEVYLGNFDVAIGDITIRYNRTSSADFTVPYTQSGIAMIVKLGPPESKNTLIFIKPLTAGLWLGSIAFLIYAGFTIWMLEPKIRAPLRRSISRHVGTVVQLSLFANQQKLESIQSNIVSVVTIFLLLVLTSCYTANLSAMLTAQQLQPTVNDIDDLKRTSENVGYKTGSFIEDLLHDDLGFEGSKMIGLEPDQFAEALDKGSANGGVTAIVHEIPYINLFLAKNCKSNSYTMVGLNFKTAGFGFAFPKGSPLVPDFTRAILNMTDGNTTSRLEKKWIGDQNCGNNGSIDIQSNRLDFYSFWLLFAILGVICTIFLLISGLNVLYKKWKIRNIEASSIATVSTSQEGDDQPPSPVDEGARVDTTDISQPVQEIEIVATKNVARRRSWS